MKKILLLICMFTVCFLLGCSNEDLIQVDNELSTSNPTVINKDKNILKDRYDPPKGFKRVDAVKGSFGEFLQNVELKDYGEKVIYYNGKEKQPEGIYDSVLKVDIGDKDLHHCADAVMLLRAEYLYKNQKYDEISFNFVNGFKAEFGKWIQGYGIEINDNSASWYENNNNSSSYESFRKYMNIVFAYAGTLSLEKELMPVDINDMEIGDVFIIGGSPGHAVIVMDMAINEVNNEKVFMLAQSYMPAQETQILINPNDKNLSPWYSLNFEGKLKTPEWTFDKNDLKRF